jgi:hypothetical protein
VLHILPKVQDMKNVYEVLRLKEMELAKLEKEVEALRLVAPLLSEEKEGSEVIRATVNGSSLSTAVNQQPIRIPQPSPLPVAATAPAARASGWEETAKRWP